MRLHRFYIPELIGSRTEITVGSSELVNQLRNVLRLKSGDEAIIFDGSGSDYLAAINRFIGTDQVILDVRSSSRSRFMPPRRTYLYAAVIKKDNFEFIVEKATELGVTDITPVIADRSEKKALNEGRLIKISVEASEQSGRGDVSKIHPIISLKDAIAAMKNGAIVTNNQAGLDALKSTQSSSNDGAASSAANIKCLVFHTDGELFNQKDFSSNEPIAIFIGPEGGWSPEEIGMFHKNGVEVSCLGTQVLRAETAVIAALSKVCL